MTERSGDVEVAGGTTVPVGHVRPGSHARRVELLALGEQLASQLTHDLRNPLAIVTSGLYLLTLDEHLPAEARAGIEDCLGEARGMCERLKQMVRGFQPQALAPQPCPASELLAVALDGVRAIAERRGTSFAVTDATSGAVVVVDPVALARAIASLVNDAFLAAGPGGTVSVRADEVKPAEVECHLPAMGRGGLSLRVQNSGRGFSPDEVAGAFEPLRVAGRRACGPDLATAMTIIEDHGGTVVIEPATAGGVYRILLPLAEAARATTGDV